jgi:hypothetical protein
MIKNISKNPLASSFPRVPKRSIKVRNKKGERGG